MAAKSKSKKSTKKKKKTAIPAAASDAEPVADADTPLGRDATTAKERRATLDWALDNPWANADVARIERVDEASFHGWEMWRR